MLKGRKGTRCGRLQLRAEKSWRLPRLALDLATHDADRAEVRQLSGTNEVPILVLDDGEVVSGSGAITLMGKDHPCTQS